MNLQPALSKHLIYLPVALIEWGYLLKKSIKEKYNDLSVYCSVFAFVYFLEQCVFGDFVPISCRAVVLFVVSFHLFSGSRTWLLLYFSFLLTLRHFNL